MIPIILYFKDVGERKASYTTAHDVYNVLSPNAKLIALSVNSWEKRLSTVNTPSLFFIASHGDIGENGILSKWLEDHGHTHTHSLSEVCALLLNKHKTKLHYNILGIPTPPWKYREYDTLSLHNKDTTVFRKKIEGGSKQGISLTTIGNIKDDSKNDFFMNLLSVVLLRSV